MINDGKRQTELLVMLEKALHNYMNSIHGMTTQLKYLITNKKNIKIKSSLYWRYYAEACNE